MTATLTVLWFGPLPAYYPAWAATAQRSKASIRWIVFTDAVQTTHQDSERLKVRPIDRQALQEHVEHEFGADLPVRTHASNFLLKCCDYRLLLPLVFPDPWYAGSEYWGWTDLDVVYGDLSLLNDPLNRGVGMVTAHGGRPCGPFTITRSTLQSAFLRKKSSVQRIAGESHAKVDEDPAFRQYVLDSGYEVYENDELLQPGMNVVPHSSRMAKWTPSGLSVRTEAGWKSSAIFHFSKLLRPGFWVAPDIQPRTPLTIDRFGIRPQGSGPPLSAIGRRYWWLTRRYLNRKLRAHALRP